MWPHEIEAFYRWYFTLPATIVLTSTTVALIDARASHYVADRRPQPDVRFRFDILESFAFGLLIWLFGVIVYKTLSWLVGGFSDDGIYTLFYAFYSLVGGVAVAFFVVQAFYRASMVTVDSVQQGFKSVSDRINAFYRRHASRWYFVACLTLVALAIIAVERFSDFAFIYKWYYIAPALLFFYGFVVMQQFGAMERYADERSAYYQEQAIRLSKWISVLAVVLIAWLVIYHSLGIESGQSSLTDHYAPTVFYGAALWTFCSLMSTWLATLLLAYIHRLPWVQLRLLVKQVGWAQGEECKTVCRRIRKVGGRHAIESLRDTLLDPTVQIAARLAAARELAEMDWQPEPEEARFWLAMGMQRWGDMTASENFDRVLDVLGHTLHQPRSTTDAELLTQVSIPLMRALGQVSDSRSIGMLVRAVRLSYEPEIDDSHVPGVPNRENTNYLKVVAARCEAAHALGAIGPAAAESVDPLKAVLRENSLDPEVREAVEGALQLIETHGGTQA